jgi:predicted dehydrogenase
MLRIGVIGYGYWGPNIVRNFNSANGSHVSMLCDMNKQALKKAKKLYPDLDVTSDPSELVKSPQVDAVAVVTPVFTHHDLARMALEAGKSVFVEKPFTATSGEAEDLLELAEKKNLRIMVDHTFLYTGAVRKIKQLVDDHVLGDVLYFDSMRVNLGLFQNDINVMWDLAPHDISIMLHVLEATPTAVVATGAAHFQGGQENVAYLTFYFKNNMIGHINVNWFSPVKIRVTFIGGEKKMLVWNDLEPDEKIKVYDKGVEVKTKEGKYSMLVDYRSGDIWVPKVEQTEALKLIAESFVDYVTNGLGRVVNDGRAGLEVVKILQAAQKSLKNMGQVQYI